MSVRVLRQVDQRSDERERLAIAIDDLRAHEAEIAAIKTAISTTEATRRQAEDALETADQQIEKAKKSLADAMVAKALGRFSGAPVDVKSLRAEAAAAQDEIDAATAALTHLQSKLGEAEARIVFKRDAVDKAWPEVVKASSELRRLLHDLAAAAQVYVNLLDVFRHGIPTEVYNERLVLPSPDASVASKWRAAIQALKTDADALLP
jgi:chromosome segregation ATPase